MLNSLALALLIAVGASTPVSDPIPGVTWNARHVEHLLNRATFGARPGEIEAGVAAGPELLIDRLLNERADIEEPFIEPLTEPSARAYKELSTDEQKLLKRDYAERERRQQLECIGWWVDRMVKGDDPLLDRMTLFWHGLLTSSTEQVNRSYPMVEQHRFLRRNALGSYSDLLYGIAKDPAMLLFLNNNSNRKGNPNENFARELLELFSLGIGNYTETDIKEAARALTGRGSSRDGKFEFRAGQHDGGVKTVLGTTGKLDGDGLVKVILQQEACPRYIARRIITYLEGVAPETARLDDYAACLRANEFQIKPFLRKLFLDPEFYRDEVIGARVQGPIDYMVGMTRRLGNQAPPLVVASGAALLGQRVLAPPNVKGWDEGLSWISTSTFMQRGNLAGLMLGIVRIDDVLNQADLLARNNDAPMEPASDGSMQGGEPMMTSEQKEAMAKRLRSGVKGGFAYDALRRAQEAGWTPSINFTARLQRQGVTSDAAIVDRMLDDLLAIHAGEETRAQMLAFLTNERVQLSVRDGKLLEGGPAVERILRRLAHVILSLPEAQLM
ncbi:MAG: DUF1800 domain-containing protein [Planctomycetes bacterium]|nr:DUF1800 domain-containing protein [Planctomycetota bacterium]